MNKSFGKNFHCSFNVSSVSAFPTLFDYVVGFLQEKGKNVTAFTGYHRSELGALQQYLRNPKGFLVTIEKGYMGMEATTLVLVETGAPYRDEILHQLSRCTSNLYIVKCITEGKKDMINRYLSYQPAEHINPYPENTPEHSELQAIFSTGVENA